MHPDWLGSPQHVVGGLVLALVVARVSRRWVAEWWLVAALAIGATATAELVVELVEYPLLYSGEPHVSAYYDTLADLADDEVRDQPLSARGCRRSARASKPGWHRRCPWDRRPPS